MFDMQAVGRRIAALRKRADMTQMELADRLDISFQAVSSWERGNTMPDIAKLPELSALFGVSIDELLGVKNPLVEAAAENRLETQLETGSVEPQVLEEAAPLLRPTQVEKAANRIERPMTLAEIAGFAPFASTGMIDEMIARWLERGEAMDGEYLCLLLPFASTGMVDSMIGRLDAQPDYTKIAEFAPFASTAKVNEMIRRCMENGEAVNISTLHLLAPFASTAVMDELAMHLLESYALQDLQMLAPFLSERVVDDLLRRAVANAPRGNGDHGTDHTDDEEHGADGENPRRSVHVHFDFSK